MIKKITPLIFGLFTILLSYAQPVGEIQKLIASDGTSNDWFSISLDISDNKSNLQ